MNELLAHIEAKNAETRAWVAAGPGRIAFEFHTDMLVWAASGVHTVEDFESLMQAEHEREMRKEAMYSQYDDHYDTDWNYDQSDDIYTTNADYGDDDYDSFDDWCAKQAEEDDNAYEIWYAENQMKKYGVDTIIMIPTHYEFMANQAGYLEY
jgi:hypothetical protein